MKKQIQNPTRMTKNCPVSTTKKKVQLVDKENQFLMSRDRKRTIRLKVIAWRKNKDLHRENQDKLCRKKCKTNKPKIKNKNNQKNKRKQKKREELILKHSAEPI